MIEGTLINLRPLLEEDLALLKEWRIKTANQRGYNFFGYRAPNNSEREFEEVAIINAEKGRFIVTLKNGVPVGDVSYHSEYYGPAATCRAYNIGIELISEARGKGYGVEAQRLLADYLFDYSVVERVEASTDIENIPEQRALEKAGFTREGIIRHAQFRAGAWHDLVNYSRLRGE